jgi:fermentation-respiration switch protein FrsA (DUF1100 family)
MATLRIWPIVRVLVLSALGFYIFLLLYFGLSQARFIYFPERRIIATPDDMGLSYEVVSLETEDEVRLSAWFIPAAEPKGVIVFCHGNAGNISHRLESIWMFHRLGLSTLIFDYRGYGQSEGKPTERGTYLDAQAALNYLVRDRNVSPSEIIVFGRSIGGAIAAWLAKEHTLGALIMESTFTSVPDFGAELYPFIPIRLISRFKYDARDCIRQAICPVLIVHSRDDELVPFRHGQRLFEAAHEPKEFLEIRGPHNEAFLISAEEYMSGLDSFISKYVTP